MGGATRSHQPARLWTVIGIVLLSVMPRGPSAASLSRYVVALEAEASTGAHTEPPYLRGRVGRNGVAAMSAELGYLRAGGGAVQPVRACLAQWLIGLQDPMLSRRCRSLWAASSMFVAARQPTGHARFSRDRAGCP